jgi:hypothetical protein
MNELRWTVMSGGGVTIDLDTCLTCETKACIPTCAQYGLGSALVAGSDGLPALGMEPERAAKGGCIECLACDLACQLDGRGALTFTLPTPEVDAYLDTLRASGGAPGRGW